MERIGLLAGSGRFPVLFAETARRRGVEVVAVAQRGETDPELASVVQAITWLYPGELDALIQEWHPSIGQAVLHEFELSEATLKAVSEHEHHPAAFPPRQLVDVITLANRVALHANPPKYPEHVERDVPVVDQAALVQSLHESQDEIRTLIAALRG